MGTLKKFNLKKILREREREKGQGGILLRSEPWHVGYRNP